MDLRIFPPDDLLTARVSIPQSKSISNRALIINSLTPGAIPITDAARCDDTDVLVNALHAISNASPGDKLGIDIGAAGTAMRFLTAYCATLPELEITLTGSERMLERPIAPLVDALSQCGAEIIYEGKEGFPPLGIKGTKLTGGNITIPGTISSQFISALLMIAPTMTNGLTINIEGQPISKPYIEMTMRLMSLYGVESQFTPVAEGAVIEVGNGQYQPAEITVEGDWSAASYWYEIEALTSGWLTLDGLSRDSVQGDRALADIFEGLGVNTEWEGEEGGIDLVASPDCTPRLTRDMSDTPDLVQAVAVTCAMLGIPFSLSGLNSLRIKETDRIEALSRELAKVGVAVEAETFTAPMATEPDTVMTWNGQRRPIFELPQFDTYNDHRMAMAFAPCAVYIPGIVIKDSEVVTKSYPDFWQDLANAGFKIIDAAEPIEPQEPQEDD